MLTLRSGPAVGLIAQVALLATLAMTTGLSAFGWFTGLTCGAVTSAAAARGLVRSGADALGRADLVTLTRLSFACGVAALVADSFVRPPAVTILVTLTVAALVLDAVDGWVARRTRTASMFGARFDGEVDAFLILILSVYVAASVGGWVLAIGAARYVFAAAGWPFPWLRAQLPPRYWRKVVATTQGVVLTVAAAEVLPRSMTYAALAVALALLVESFGRDVWWLWRHRHDAEERPVEDRRARRAVAGTVANTLALLLVWFALVAPNQAYDLTPSTLLRIPAEGLVVAGLALVLPPRARRAMAAAVGVLLGVVSIVKVLDMGFFAAFDRPFNLVTDRGYLGPAVALLSDTIGALEATVTTVAAAVLVLAVLICMPLSVGRLAALVARHRRWSVPVVSGLVVTWIACAAAGFHVVQGEPIASTNTSRLAVDHVRAMATAARDEQRFDAAAATDHFRAAADRDVLTRLHGKDVLVVFVESYGRIAIEGLPSSPQVRQVLDTGTRRLRASGYSSRSAFLTSPTLGGLSWLAHATLQSGLWVDNQARYERLLSSDRLTLSRAFGQAGWRTVALMPSNDASWPEGQAFYQFDKIYDSRAIEYHGPAFGFSDIPDQYALSAFQRLELAKRERAPVMAEVDLTSSHAPWARIPRMIDWQRLGDGSVYHRVHGQIESKTQLWSRFEDVQAAYAKAVGYSLKTLVSFVEEYGDDDLVLVVVGDHQPRTVVSGHGARHDVPVSIVAHDPKVIEQIDRWRWHEGLRPGRQAPVWPMDAFRDRLLAAYSPGLPADPPRAASP